MGKDGVKRHKMSVVAHRIHFLGSPQSGGNDQRMPASEVRSQAGSVNTMKASEFVEPIDDEDSAPF